ncbi:putative glycine dehydrogenase (decarboxylating) subunit 1 [Legionella geestiana]|uniref:Probable glycine dehydrogenase (decarboxylating) subunit 1 n=1 Tax=Legionella geestiana TaxID=45065 RepID=A0A0W0TP11_9GAMM|nr:aminomethyl-transferring glycine dehydrogenase subunit GcvPA [Legionella geestiana]KTC97316.1 putative glycine dehydrogenase (decarboxylating) subunit 1 [Legionella geestiana]QBS12443.1 aminomethyl-transferring glycine dehydrogenase subunit GcvPA [Legionella geestiana]QDQ39843.1 aminomethyl-transferring glycine dehydrogenase subunit GcvPA [Legionella geestiana]STX55116.1 glycine dehydrogenase subunit 1 [Legionella geestiana]
MPFIPHTEADRAYMLNAIGINDVDTLFEEIPAHLRAKPFTRIPEGVPEMVMLREAGEIAAQNRNGICFMGAGAYEHHIPAAVWDITSRGEFMTAYTPYQAEASQGTLEVLYEFQTMIAELTGMDVANASLYDGASALAEAVLMSVRLARKPDNARVLVAGTLHPFWREALETIVRPQHIEVITLPFDPVTGTLAPDALVPWENEDITALVIAQPNFFGALESVDSLCDWAHAHNSLCIACVNPVSLALLKPPGQWGTKGADIVCGEGQPLGSPMASGGPWFGFFSTRLANVRQMPGRLVGKTLDRDGNPGFTLTLQAREQHIRRGKATSNICTNQGLLVTAATIHMSLLGPDGLEAVARHCHHNTRMLVERLTGIQGVRRAFSTPFFHECLLSLDRAVEPLLMQLSEKGILGGFATGTHYPEIPNGLLVCATEMRTEADIARYAKTLEALMRS